MLSTMMGTGEVNLRQFEIAYMTWFQVFKLLIQEIFTFPIIWGVGTITFFFTWWIYALYGMAQRMFSKYYM